MKNYKIYYELLAKYGNGWESVFSADTKEEINKIAKDYQLNDTFARGFKIKTIREDVTFTNDIANPKYKRNQ